MDIDIRILLDNRKHITSARAELVAALALVDDDDTRASLQLSINIADAAVFAYEVALSNPGEFDRERAAESLAVMPKRLFAQVAVSRAHCAQSDPDASLASRLSLTLAAEAALRRSAALT